jgi:hypothetical protein
MTLYLLNLADLFFTLHALSHGAVELNPFMQNIPFMVVYKTIVVGVLIWWIKRRSEPIARCGLYAITIFYAIVNWWHIWNVFLKG